MPRVIESVSGHIVDRWNDYDLVIVRNRNCDACVATVFDREEDSRRIW